MKQLRKHFLIVGLGLVLAAPLPSQAAPGAGEIASAIVSLFMAYVMPPLIVLHAQTDATTQISALKTSLANKAVAEGVAEWQVKEEIRRDGVRVSHSLQQPETTCSSMAQASVGPKVDASVKSATYAKSASHVVASHTMPAVEASGTSYAVPPLHSNVNATQQVVKTYDYVMSNYCTAEDAAKNRCGGRAAATKYPGGDMRAELLFSDNAGNDTMAADQSKAVDAFINTIADSMAPEMLRNPEWDQTAEGRKYVLMVREYSAFMSLAKHSLHTIEMNHMPIAGLGDAMDLTKDPRFANRHDISRMEAADLYIKTKWSPDSIKDMATATEPAPILRDIAMMSSYRLWLEYQSLAASERQEAVLSGQLALMTRQAYTAPLEAQKQRATANGNSAGAS